MHKFDLFSQKLRDVKLAISGGELSSHQAAFKSLSPMDHVKQVIQVFDPETPDVTYHFKLVDQFQICTYSTISAFIPINEPRGNAVQYNTIQLRKLGTVLFTT